MQSKPDLASLLVRADADTTRGTGHVMRCLALAQAWQSRGGHASFLSHCDSPLLCECIQASGAELIRLKQGDSVDVDIETTLSQLSQRATALLVLDGYHIDFGQQQALRVTGHPLLVIDDNAHLDRYHADIVLNQNLGASQLNYQCSSDTTMLMGPSYAMLRSEFSFWRRRFRVIRGAARKILVTLGGSDPNNFTLRVIEALARLGAQSLEVRVVVGPANPHLATLRAIVDSVSLPIQLLTQVPDMASLMAWADLAVSAAGTTCWELACMGLPAVTIVLAENQKRIAEELDAMGVVHNLGWHGDVSVDRLAGALDILLYSSFRRLRMSQQGRVLVDGRGADRVVQALLEHSCMRAA